MRKYSLILFDMDGTIIDSDEMIIQSLFTLYDKYNNGVRKPREELYKYSGPLIEDTLKIEFPNVDPEAILNDYITISREYSEKLLVPITNIKEIIGKLKDNGVFTGIVTNKHTVNAIKSLEITGMQNLFDILIGYNEVDNHKPSGDGILLAMKLLNIKNKEDVLYVGDNDIDFYTAKNAEVDCALLNWGPRAKV